MNPTIHGKTKIELYNPRTRIKNIVESENTFQSAVLANFMKDYGYFDANLYRSSVYTSRPRWANLVGGLFLFKNGIDVGTQFMPAGNKMVGNGSYGTVNNSDPTELGSYNSNESAATSSAITQVYDFTTSQANGSIGCVCLTSADGGLIGYGNASGGRVGSSSLLNFNNSQSPRAYLGSMQAYYSGYIYTFPNAVTNGSMQVTKTRVPAVQGSVFDEISTTLTIDTSALSGASNWNLAGTYYLDRVFDCGNGKFRFLPYANSWGYSSAVAGGNVYFFEFDATTDSLIVGHFVNSSSSVVQYTDIVSGSHGAEFLGDYCLTQYKLFKVSTSEYIMNTQYVHGGPVIDYDAMSYNVEDSIIVGHTSGNYYLLDAVNQTEYPINAKNGFDKCYALNNLQGGYKNPLYLATINNIQPVSKTAAQTMKVTYTLTEVE